MSPSAGEDAVLPITVESAGVEPAQDLNRQASGPNAQRVGYQLEIMAVLGARMAVKPDPS
jgi:hypothetical protein